MSDSKPAPTVFPEPAQFDLSSFACPRCGETTSAASYGPCPACVDALHAAQRGEGGGEAAAAYEPKMNVTPNAVALKE